MQLLAILPRRKKTRWCHSRVHIRIAKNIYRGEDESRADHHVGQSQEVDARVQHESAIVKESLFFLSLFENICGRSLLMSGLL